ncbi:MAG: UDP-N-acetylmuramate--L-alanine ligase [Patescibacteria group bacterium]|nr:UDP-N-acetylmuramate--L-alanine ligase [Patescibacteria group bacterium]
MDFSKFKKIYMIGIKGVGMTMLAQFLVSKGYNVSGSDTAEVFMTDQILAKFGIKVNQGFSADNVPFDADLIIYSSAYNLETNAEVGKALAGKIKTLTYAEVLGEIFNQMYGIAVCGSHGKTTTTAWLGYVLMKAGLKPNVLVGARVEQFDGAGTYGDSDYLVIEADEYQNKLKYYNPKAVLLNNIDHDHHDFFPTLESYIDAFVKFIEKIPKKGFLVTNFDDPIIARVANVKKVNCEAREATLGCCRGKIISYALDRADVNFYAHDIKQQGLKQFFKVRYRESATTPTPSLLAPRSDSGVGERRRNEKPPLERGGGREAGRGVLPSETEELGDFSISLSGKHNIYNALAVIAASIELGVDLKDIRTYLEEFTGTDRRAKIMGKFNGATIIDDYGHHPTEIKATLSGLRAAYPDQKIIAVFHPHTFTRTKALLNEFAQSFSDADKVIVLDIYGSAREKQGGVSSLDLIAKMKEYEENKPAFAKATVGKNFVHVHDLLACEKYLRETVDRGQVVVLIGAGDVFRVGEALING